MKKVFAALLFVFSSVQFSIAQVDRREIEIEAFGEQIQVLNVGKEGLVFFYPVEAEGKKAASEFMLKGYDKELTETWSQTVSVPYKFELLKFNQDKDVLSLLFQKKTQYRVVIVSLVDGNIIRDAGVSSKYLDDVNAFDFVSTNVILHGKEGKYPVSYALDPYSSRLKKAGGKDLYKGNFAQRVGTVINSDKSGYFDFVNEFKGRDYTLNAIQYDGAGQKISSVDMVLGSNKMLNEVESRRAESGDVYLLGTYGNQSGSKKLKPSKDRFELSNHGDKGFVFGKLNEEGQLLFVNTIELKQVKSFLDVARQIPSFDTQLEDLKASKKRLKSPGILNPLDADGNIIHQMKFHDVYDVDELTKVVVVEFYHPEANYLEKKLPRLPLKNASREDMMSMEAKDLVDEHYRGIRASALLIMAVSNIDGSLLWDYTVKLDGNIMDDTKTRAKLLCTPEQTIVAYGADNTVVTKTLQNGAVVDNAITSVPAPDGENGKRRIGKGTITSGLLPWYDNMFFQYEYKMVKVKKSKSKKKKKNKTLYSFTVLPVYN